MIRKAKIKDIVPVMRITDACGQHLIRQEIYQWNDQYPRQDIFEKDIERGELYVIEKDDEIIGCMVMTQIKDVEYNPVEWLSEDGNNIYIHRLAVHPDHQGKGYARELMDFAEDLAKTEIRHSIRLDTFSKNIRNQRFYEKRGYKRLGNVYFHDQSTEPFFCYELLL